MARGLNKFQAEQLIVTGFFEEVLNRVPVEGVRRKLEQVIARKCWLRQERTLEQPMKGYVTPEVLGDHPVRWPITLTIQKIRIVESNEDILLYDMGHVPAPYRSTGRKT